MAVAFLMAGGMKLVTTGPELVEQGMAWAGRVPSWSIPVIGILEVLGGIGLILPSALRILPILTPAAAAGLTLTMLVAGLEHAVAGEFGNVVPNIVLGLMTTGIAFGRLKLAPIDAK